ncbi:MAG TPA: hypothetical protein VFA26_13560, partial [Gemmataceae bacterium]|nr:hypothetical protein [Gemmataceae bacterium]
MVRSSPPRTHVLTEWASAVCRLAPDDVDFLLAHHRHHVELLPAGRRGRYLLTPRGHVGTIVAPTCRLVLRPKLPAASLLYFLDPDAPPPAAEDWATTRPGAEALDLLAGRLAQLLAERA